jgi:FecR-like protein
MFDTIRFYFAPLLLLTFVTFCLGSGAMAEEAVWRVSKSSGDASVTTAGQWLALTEGVTVKLGDNVRTGQNGQVLLKRGEETILMSPNSVIGIAAESKSGLSTTIIQQAGSILLEVEKRPVKHFAVETPSIAAVVKGTRFRVTVNSSDSRVDVLGGQVEVQDFKSGQYAMVLPKQTAMVSSQGPPGLLLSGLGKLNPIEQGTPRSASVSPMPPESHLSVSATNEQPFPTASGPITIPAASLVPPNSKQPDWSLRLASFVMSFAKSKATGPQNRREDLVFAGAVAGAIFLAVSSTVAMTQRRRKSKAKLAAFR